MGFNPSNLFRKKGLGINTFWYTIGTFLLRGISFISLPLFTKLLLPADFGYVNVYITWISFFSVILGMQTLGTIPSARVHYGKDRYNEYLSSALTLSCVAFLVLSTIICLFGTYIAAFMNMSLWLLVLLLIQAFATYIVNYALQVYVNDKQPLRYLALSFFVTFSSIILSVIWILLLKDQKYLGRIYGNSIPYILAAAYALYKIFTRGKTFFDIKYWKYCLPMAIPLILHNLSGLILAQADRIMLLKLLPDGQAVTGIYSFAYSIGMAVDVLWLAFNNAWVPWYYYHLKEKALARIQARTNQYILLFTRGTIIFILIAPELVKLVSKPEYWSGLWLLPLVILAYYLHFLYSFPVNYQFYKRKTKWIALGTSIAAIINILLNFILIPLYGMYGAAISTLIAYILLLLSQDVIARFVLKGFHYKWWIYLLGLVPVIGAIAIYYVALDFLLVRWIIAFFVGVLGLIALYFAQKSYKRIK